MVPGVCSAVALGGALAANILIAVIAAVLRSTVLRADLILAVAATVDLTDSALVEVVLVLSLGRRRWRGGRRRRLFPLHERLTLIAYLFLLNKVVVGFVASDDDLLGFATFLSYDDRGLLRSGLSNDDGLGWRRWLLVIFSFPPVPFNFWTSILVMVMMVVVGW